MSDATYRIDTVHSPNDSLSVRWVARVTRLSDEARVASLFSDTEENAVREAQAWIFELTEKQEGHTFYVDEQGEPVEQHSVKA